MTNLAFSLEHNSDTTFHVDKDTFIFDGNSKSAHIIARTLLINDITQKFALIPKQNTLFFGINIPFEYNDEKFLLIGKNGEVLRGNAALESISVQLNLKRIYH